MLILALALRVDPKHVNEDANVYQDKIKELQEIIQPMMQELMAGGAMPGGPMPGGAMPGDAKSGGPMPDIPEEGPAIEEID